MVKMANQWDRTLLYLVPVLLTSATHDRIRSLADKIFHPLSQLLLVLTVFFFNLR